MSRLNQQNYKKESRSIRFNHSTSEKQRGITAIAMVLILILVGFFALLAIRLFPIYVENLSVSAHLEWLAGDSQTRDKTNKDIYSTLKKRFQIDNVANVTSDDITVVRESGNMIIIIEYEVRTPAIGNVDMVVSFYEEAQVK